MIRKEFIYTWEWELNSSPESLWPYVSDTNRFNQDSKLPSVTYASGKDSELLLNRKLQFSFLGVKVEYEEFPFEWVKPHFFTLIRQYSKGPVTELHVKAELKPRPEGGTTLIYTVRTSARSFFAALMIPVTIGIVNARKFESVFRKFDVLAQRKEPSLEPSSEAVPKIRYTPNGKARLNSVCSDCKKQVDDTEIVDKISDFIATAPDMSVLRIKPYILADKLGNPRKDVLEHFLYATRAGMVDFQWDLMCPLCRGTKASSKHLKDMESDVHCNTCNINFKTQFDRSVELTFKPNPSIRDIEVNEFCVGGPQVTPHIYAQQMIQPNEQRTIYPVLNSGSHRLRTFDKEVDRFFEVNDAGSQEATFSVNETEDIPDTIQLTERPVVHLVNNSDEARLFIIEHIRWRDDAVIAGDVISLQLFRDLFSDEALRPGEQVSVGTVTILFTDLKGSTKMYREIGDAPAFGKVMDHFDVLKNAISMEKGAIIKTIGDAIIGVFTNPAACLRAILNAQKAFSTAEGDRRLRLKAGINTGPCIAVTLNGRLDYFGTTVNMAARLEGFSNGGDVILSDTVYRDMEVPRVVSQYSLGVEQFDAELKGFDEENFQLRRLCMKM